MLRFQLRAGSAPLDTGRPGLSLARRGPPRETARAQRQRGRTPPAGCRSAGGRRNWPHLRGTLRRGDLRRRCGRHRGHAAFADDHGRAHDRRPAAAGVAVAAGITPRGARPLADRGAAACVIARGADRRGAHRGARRATRNRAARGSTTPAVPPTGLRIESRHHCGHAGERPNQSTEDLGRHRKHPSRESRESGGRPRAGCLLPRAGNGRHVAEAAANRGPPGLARPTGHFAEVPAAGSRTPAEPWPVQSALSPITRMASHGDSLGSANRA